MKAPFVFTVMFALAARATGASGVQSLGIAPHSGKIASVSYVPDAPLTGAATNTRKIELINKGQSGGGTTVAASLQFNAGVDLVAFDEKAIPVSVVANAANVVAGDVLAINSAAVGSGIADGGGVIIVKIAREL